MGNRQNRFKDLISHSRKMLEHAQNIAWDDVAEIESERHEMLKTFFLEPIPSRDARRVSSGIQEIMTLDNEIMKLATANKEALAEKLKTLEQGKKAVKAYNSDPAGSFVPR